MAQNSDLFWALRGGGGSTFGVATSVTVKAFPDMTTTAAAFKFSTADGISNLTFWAGVRSYFDYFIDNADAGTYSYFRVLANNPGPGHFTLQMSPFLAPNKTLKDVESLLGPWLTDLADMGIKLAPNITEYDSFYPSWKDFFPLEGVAKVNIQSGSRLFPRKNFESEDLKQATFDAIRKSVETNHVFIGFNMKMVSPDDPDNAVNPAWRDNILFAIQLGSWSINATADQILKIREEFTHGHMQRWRDVSPGAGSYLAESDRMEPNFQQSFYGDEKYTRLLELKKKWDPEDVFYAATAVGSEFWTIETADGLPHENGRLCRVEE
ncbi:hypothetical protein COL154_001807 [Colletotrichum chrysophilum]|nr:hypothetical protein KNSL1_010810 [Colletotrichum chrysophilum]KAJ0370001.1 hypothetical protein COL154_001807 [Colletotrichum chrysophilum]